MKFTTDHDEFTFAHGRKPSGRGNWFVQVTLTGDGCCSDAGMVNTNGTLTEALKAAKDHARREAAMCGRATGATLTVCS